MSDGTISWFKEIVGNIISHPLGQLVTEEVKKLMQMVTPTDRNYVRYKLTGQMPLEDENLYNLADAELGKDAPNVARLHSARVGQLLSHMQDYYRLTMCGYRDEAVPRDQDDRRRINNMKIVMRRNALMNDAEWKDKVRIMNLDQAKAATLAEQIKKAGSVPVDAVKKAVSDFNTDVTATGLPAAFGNIRTKLTDRIKNQLK